MSFKNYTEKMNEVLNNFDDTQIEQFISLIMSAFKNEKTIFVIGNGGSAANASHLAQDLSKGTRKHVEQTKRIRAMSLTDNVSFITALGNDDGYDTVFEQQLRTFAKEGDYLIAISGSGNSPNIIRVVEWANDNGIITIGVTGFNGGKLKTINNYSLHTELNDMGMVEAIHGVVFHYIIAELYNRINN